METDKQQLEIIDLMMGIELKMSSLYLIYASSFSNMKLFWHDLAEEEKDHAHWLVTLKDKIKDKKVFINKGRFKKPAINFIIKNLDNVIINARKEKDIISALAISYDLETSLLERHYFEIFASDSAEIKEVLIFLDHETKKHSEMVREKLQLARQKKKL